MTLKELESKIGAKIDGNDRVLSELLKYMAFAQLQIVESIISSLRMLRISDKWTDEHTKQLKRDQKKWIKFCKDCEKQGQRLTKVLKGLKRRFPGEAPK